MGTAIGHVTSKDGTSIGYERSGSGPPLVLVHGTTADRTRWTPVLPAFEERFTVYAMDRRGRGLSGEGGAYSLEREYEDIAGVVDAVGEPVNLLGHSYGALCAMEAVLLTPNVRRLVLYEPAFRTGEPLYPPDLRERLKAMLAKGDRDGAVATFLLEAAGIPEDDLAMMRAAPSWPSRLAAAHTLPQEFADNDYVLDSARFKHLDVPVLLLSGSESSADLRAATDAAHAALPNSKLVVMEGQGHIAVTTAPDLFARLVIDFLAS